MPGDGRRPRDRLPDAVAAPKPVPDTLGRDLAVLFCGINPSLTSAARGHHFARPGNRFWPALHGAGFTPRRLAPEEDHLLPDFGVGVTNLVDRATRSAADLAPQELRTGVPTLAALVSEWRPRIVAIVGIGAYRTAFERPKAALGPQPDTLAGAPLWVLPNPSGLNAHHQLPELVELFAELREAAMEDLADRPPRRARR